MKGDIQMSFGEISPFQTIEALREHLARSFEENTECTCSISNWYLPIEVSEDESNFYVRTLVPGLDPNKINIEVENGIVTISAEFIKRELNENEKIHISDFCYGKLKRSVKIGTNIESDNISATDKQGLLNITIPKTAKAVRKNIEIKNLE